MSKSVGFKWGSVSITGNFRDNNEDNCHADAGARYFIVADGMGGQSAGEKASALAIELVSEKLNQWLDFEKDGPDRVIANIDRAVSFANHEIMALGALDAAYKGMGTTLTFIVRVGSLLFVAGVGDSRTYLLRGGKLQQLTKDHSLTQALVDAGTISDEEAATHRYRNVLYRYLGTKEGSQGTEPKVLTPENGDRYMMCSDGVTDGTKPEEIQKLLSSIDDPQQAAVKIVEAAQAGGSRDNITCIVVHVV